MTYNHRIRIAIASGKGGTGKTLISTSLFYVLQQENYNVSLIDCDAEEPNVMLFFKEYYNRTTINVIQKIPFINQNECLFCGKCQEYCNYNAIFFLPNIKKLWVMNDLCHNCGACFIACKNDAISEDKISLGVVSIYKISSTSSVIEGRTRVGVYSPVPVIKAALKNDKDHDIHIIDSPPGISCPFIQTASNSDYVILITEPTPFGLNDLKLAVGTLQKISIPFGVIVNRCGLGDYKVYEWLKKENIKILMEIPFDREIAEIYSKGDILSEKRMNYRKIFTELFDEVKNSLLQS